MKQKPKVIKLIQLIIIGFELLFVILRLFNILTYSAIFFVSLGFSIGAFIEWYYSKNKINLILAIGLLINVFCSFLIPLFYT